MRRKAVWAAVIAGAIGCGKSAEQKFPAVPTGDDGGPPSRTVAPITGGTGGSGRGGAGGGGAPIGDGGVGAAKVTVRIEAPKPADIVPGKKRFTPDVMVVVESPMDGAADNIMEVKAFAKSVKDPMVPGAEATLNLTKLERMPELRTAIYRYQETPLDLSMLESGEYELRVAARTAAGGAGEAKLSFLVDAGPAIRIESPGNNRYYRSAARVEVVMSDAQFGPIQDVSMSLGPRPLKFDAPTTPGGKYTANIVFNDYDPPLEGDQLLTVRASNRNKTETVAVVKFIADDKGPLMANTVPKVGDLIGKVITISAQITDPAGVLDSSVVAVVAHGDTTYEVKLRPPAMGTMAPANTYQGLFDTARLCPPAPARCKAVFPHISFRASDVLGNESSVGYLTSLDNTGPLADLDPPKIRLARMDGPIWRCSWQFDPLGADAVSDGQSVLQLFDIRVRLQDEGNEPVGGADFIPISGVDEARAQLLILDDTSRPLVVDTNGDGVCDNVNPLLTPTTRPMSSTDALLINLVPIPPTGSGDFTPDPSVTPDLGCAPGKETMPPKPICYTTEMTVAISYTNAATPAIWTIPPVAGDGLQCVGRQFDALANSISDGWVCIAVAASDKLGNLQVSRPLRVCIDKDKDGKECGPAAGPPPNCTGTVTMPGPPPVVDGAKSCKPWALYGPDEIRWQR